ncbi:MULTISPECIES: ABC transporter ATP-binding protein [unclassified Haladaptatus]|uniref:ABC transporter ATP-binding protein n=1 Tax=unclassified Haladaptatus TaxID=2622732 RepID=UPI0023E795B5|nr:MULTISPECIES: ABC transporter ATP-binding protein [unclassified Haladaptatus]
MPAIETTSLTKEYDGFAALTDLSLSVDHGSLYGLLGPNGSGKTTTLSILTGQLVPTAGSARVLDVDPVEDPVEVRKKVGILPEREDPPSFMTPREYLTFVSEVRDLDDPEYQIARWADRLGFEDRLDTLATDLSEGERQRVMLAQAFVHDPQVVFIDEPLVNLDPIMQERVKRLFVDYCDVGNTLFLSTHFISVAEEICTNVGILSNGRLIAERDPRTLEDGEGLLEYFLSEVDAAKTAGEATVVQ